MTLRLHHMGILVKDIARGVDDYVKRFGYEVKSDVIHDPVQTAFVQFVKLAGESAYIEFVTPDGPNSKLSNALQKGGGINHLCYLTEDIQKTCEDLTDKGMFLLQVPVDAVAFPERRIAWLIGRDGIPVELVEEGEDKWKIE